MIGPVQIEFLDGLDVIVLRGHKRDVRAMSCLSRRQIDDDVAVRIDGELRDLTAAISLHLDPLADHFAVGLY